MIEDDPGYGPHVHRCTIMLDGKPAHDCVFADADFGVVVRYATDANGKPIGYRGELQLEYARGKVEIIPDSC